MLTVSTVIELVGHIHLFTLNTATQNTALKVHINDRSYRSCIEETTDLCFKKGLDVDSLSILLSFALCYLKPTLENERCSNQCHKQ